MKKIANKISASLTSTQATEKAMDNIGRLGFILSLFQFLEVVSYRQHPLSFPALEQLIVKRNKQRQE